MLSLRITATLIVCMLIFLGHAGCDDYNIVEPRFYDGDDIVALPTCGELEDSSDVLPPPVLPDAFAFGVCRAMFPETGAAIVIAYDVPARAEINLGLFNSAGILVRTIVRGIKDAGSYADYVADLKALDGGVYAISMVAGEFHHAIWFEID